MCAGSDLALLKKRVDELAPPKEAGALLMMREGDHAMLAAKPLQGYRSSTVSSWNIVDQSINHFRKIVITTVLIADTMCRMLLTIVVTNATV